MKGRKPKEVLKRFHVGSLTFSTILPMNAMSTVGHMVLVMNSQHLLWQVLHGIVTDIFHGDLSTTLLSVRW